MVSATDLVMQILNTLKKILFDVYEKADSSEGYLTVP
jgi:hypothetical protein